MPSEKRRALGVNTVARRSSGVLRMSSDSRTAGEPGPGYVRCTSDARSTAEAWALLVLLAVDAPTDPCTVSAWAKAAGASPAALRQRCYASGVQPGRSLRFARLLRAVRRSHGGLWRPTEWLKVADTRTMLRMLEDGGLRIESETVPTALEFIHKQRLVPLEHPTARSLMALLVGDENAGFREGERRAHRPEI